jgi:hypothetical protein
MWKPFISVVLSLLVAGCSTVSDAPDPVASAEATAPVAAGTPAVSPEVERQYEDALALIRDSNRDAARKLLLQITQAQPELSGL